MSAPMTREEPTTRKGRLSAQSIRVRANLAAAEERAKLFVVLCRQRGLPAPDREALFARPRKWRFDFAWPDQQLALEVEGGAWSNGAHGRGKHFLSDMDKYNTAALNGWRVLRTVPGQLCTDETITMLRAALRIERAAGRTP